MTTSPCTVRTTLVPETLPVACDVPVFVPPGVTTVESVPVAEVPVASAPAVPLVPVPFVPVELVAVVAPRRRRGGSPPTPGPLPPRPRRTRGDLPASPPRRP